MKTIVEKDSIDKTWAEGKPKFTCLELSSSVEQITEGELSKIQWDEVAPFRFSPDDVSFLVHGYSSGLKNLSVAPPMGRKLPMEFFDVWRRKDRYSFVEEFLPPKRILKSQTLETKWETIGAVLYPEKEKRKPYETCHIEITWILGAEKKLHGIYYKQWKEEAALQARGNVSRMGDLAHYKTNAEKGTLSPSYLNILLEQANGRKEVYDILLMNYQKKLTNEYSPEDPLNLLCIKKFAKENSKVEWVQAVEELERVFYEDLFPVLGVLRMGFRESENVISIEEAKQNLEHYIRKVYPGVCEHLTTYVHPEDQETAKRIYLKNFVYGLKIKIGL